MNTPPILPAGVELMAFRVLERVYLEYHDDNRLAVIESMRGWHCTMSGPRNPDGSRQFAVYERVVGPTEEA